MSADRPHVLFSSIGDFHGVPECSVGAGGKRTLEEQQQQPKPNTSKHHCLLHSQGRLGMGLKGETHSTDHFKDRPGSVVKTQVAGH